MSFRALAIVPGVLVVATFAALLALGMPPDAVRVEIEAVKLAALIGSWAAAISFDRDDYLRRAWQLMAASFAFLLLRDALYLFGDHEPLPGAAIWIPSLVLCSNVCGVLSALLMARTFKVAGLSSETTDGTWRTVTVVAFVIAIVTTSPTWVVNLRDFSFARPGSLVALISALGDVISLSLIAPILMTAIAMRGGALIWPWALLTSAMMAWLFYDLSGTLAQLGLLNPAVDRATEELFRALACVYTAAAGLAQRKIIRQGAG